MNNLSNLKIIRGKSFKIYRESVQAILNELVEKKEAKVIYEDLYKDSKKQSFYGIDDCEVIYRTNDNEFYLLIAVTKDSYLSQMGINIRESECIVELDEDEVLDYLEYKVATGAILKYFSDKLICDKHDVIRPSSCYIKDRKVYDINQSVSLKLYTDEYIRYGEEVCEYEELYIDKSGAFFLHTLCDSVRLANSNLYFRNKEAEIREKADILVMTEDEAIRWWVNRIDSSLEEFEYYLEQAKSNLNNIN